MGKMNTIVFAAGIGNLVSNIIDNWLGPAFLLFVAACAITFIKDREFRKLFSYVGIATVNLRRKLAIWQRRKAKESRRKHRRTSQLI